MSADDDAKGRELVPEAWRELDAIVRPPAWKLGLRAVRMCEPGTNSLRM